MIVQDVIRCGRADGTTLSKDRVARIKATAARVKAEQEGRLEAAVEGECAHLQDDLAFCFVSDNGNKKLWLGKLQQMRSKIGKRSRNLHQSVTRQMICVCSCSGITRQGQGREGTSLPFEQSTLIGSLYALPPV